MSGRFACFRERDGGRGKDPCRENDNCRRSSDLIAQLCAVIGNMRTVTGSMRTVIGSMRTVDESMRTADESMRTARGGTRWEIAISTK